MKKVYPSRKISDQFRRCCTETTQFGLRACGRDNDNALVGLAAVHICIPNLWNKKESHNISRALLKRKTTSYFCVLMKIYLLNAKVPFPQALSTVTTNKLFSFSNLAGKAIDPIKPKTTGKITSECCSGILLSERTSF